MFTVIEFSDNKKGLISKLFSGIIHEMPELTKVAVNGGAPFFKIKVIDNKKIPWDDIVYMAGRCASNVLLSEDVKFPKDLRVNRFNAKEFPLITLSNTAKKVFSDLNLKRIRLGICDAEGILSNRIKDFVNFASEITIFTKRPEKYFKICEMLMDEYGMSIVLSDYEDALISNDFIISENALKGLFCLSVKNEGSESALEFSGIELPLVFKQKLPEGIDDEYFAAALYELCGVSLLGNVEFNTVKFKNKIFSVSNIKEILKN